MWRRRIVWLAVGFEAGVGVVALGLAWVLDVPLVPRPPSWRELVFGVVAALPMLGVLIFVTRSSWTPAVNVRRRIHDELVPVFAGCSLADFVLIAAAAGVAEELLFRAVLQRWATPAGPAVAIIATSVLFGAGHALTMLYAVLAMAISIYLGTLYHMSGTVVIPMVAHGVYDVIALAVLCRPGGMPSQRVHSETDFHPPSSTDRFS